MPPIPGKPRQYRLGGNPESGLPCCSWEYDQNQQASRKQPKHESLGSVTRQPVKPRGGEPHQY